MEPTELTEIQGPTDFISGERLCPARHLTFRHNVPLPHDGWHENHSQVGANGRNSTGGPIDQRLRPVQLGLEHLARIAESFEIVLNIVERFVSRGDEKQRRALAVPETFMSSQFLLCVHSIHRRNRNSRTSWVPFSAATSA